MKILHLISGGDVGGAKTHVLSLLHGLNRSDTAELVCFTEGDFAADARALGIPTTILDGGFRSTLAALRERIAGGGYDVLHCHGSKANMFGALLKKHVPQPLVTTIHSDPRLDYLGRPLHNLTYGTINKLSLRRFSNWIAVSDDTAEMLIGRGFDPQRVFTLYNGVDFSARTPAQPREDYLRGLGLDFDENTVVFGIAARISPVKDLPTLIRAFAALTKTTPNVRLIVAGDGEQADEIKALAAELCPAGSVCFAGWISDTDSFYQALDVNLLTSLSEGFPYSLPEGARWRCATVSSKVGGVGRIVLDGVTGILFRPGDVDALTDAMRRLAEDPALRRHYGEKIYEKAAAEFSLDTMLEKQRGIYRTVLSRAARSDRKRDGVMICGAYGKRNAGDDGILEAILCQLRALDPDLPVWVMSRRPGETRMLFRVGACHTFNVPGFLHRMRKTALYISGGGSLIQDVTSSRSLQYYLYHIRAAKKRGNPVMMYGCGIGPVSGKANRKKAGRVISRNVDVIALRDAQSMKELQRLGVSGPRILLTADTALCLPAPSPDAEAAYLRAQGFAPGKDYLMVSLRPWPGIDEKLPAIAAAVDEAADAHDAELVLFALEPRRDIPLLERFAELLHCKYRIVPAPTQWQQLISLIRRMRGVLSMRLHPLVFAAGQGVPVAGIVYDPKVNGFMDELGKSSYCSVDEIDTDRIRALLAQMLDGDADRAETERRVEQLRARARANADEAAALLREAR